jgi:glutamine synthetase
VHEDVEKCATLLSGDGKEAMSAVRDACDALELSIADEAWPLPRYREMLFPV